MRLDDERQCFRVIIGATADERRRLLAVHDGFRESEFSWTEVLEDLKSRGLTEAPKLAVGRSNESKQTPISEMRPLTSPNRLDTF